MLSLQYCVFSLLFLYILTGVSCEELTPVKNEEYSLEGSTVTLSYRYSKSADMNDYFFWYRQYPGKPLEFIMFISGMNITKTAESLKSDTRFFTELTEEKRRVDLQISSAAVTDSAVYYCAVRPTVTANTKTLYEIMFISGMNITRTAESLKSDTRFFTELTEEKRRVDLQISSAAVTDSAVYYCALQPTVTANTKTLYKNIMSKDNTILHNIHQRESHTVRL
ncbi:uncharacterized protein LOC126409126 [Epinephelus moara]|uniref:uncharacterized protein LOC126409126 n=1 Tax=Epinephelus moara TaxID=300413 RepID=UPI00214EBEEE|nr:uncharacterized protein LOC126409126 [Epinephelus moara]